GEEGLGIRRGNLGQNPRVGSGVPVPRSQVGREQLVHRGVVVGEDQTGGVPVGEPCFVGEAARDGGAGQGRRQGFGVQGRVGGEDDVVAAGGRVRGGAVRGHRDVGEDLAEGGGLGGEERPFAAVDDVDGVQPVGAQHPADLGGELPGGQVPGDAQAAERVPQ